MAHLCQLQFDATDRLYYSKEASKTIVILIL